ncbi:MAG: AhpC/TSA family protein [Bacteroidales bacterium]|nr:AhpC/TSA family protein [Bacteroidales bacterium]MBN2632013.1 AhpC/TSA family protein [Bacteroidales bacterium]
MIKKVLLFLFTAVAFAGCKNNNIEIIGKLKGHTEGEYLYLDELKSTDLITVDSAAVSSDGTFRFSRTVKFPSFYLLKTDETNFLMLLLEPGQKLQISAYRDSLNFPEMITGSPGTMLMNEYNIRLQKTQISLQSLYETYIENLGTERLDTVMEELENRARVCLDELNSYTRDYIDRNLNSLVSLVALYQQVAPGEYILSPEKDLTYFLKVDSAMMRLYPAYEPVISLHEQVSGLKSAMITQQVDTGTSGEGFEAPEIALPGTDGDTVRLSSTRGKIVLLDFWASWCGPCRKENPNLVKAYGLYHDKGFEIFQVSLDKSKEAWMKGISDDGLGKWIHVSDIKYWQSAVVPLYNLEKIPSSFLLDRKGKIIARDLRGDELLKTLSEVFSE